jgi:hypothetical protein
MDRLALTAATSGCLGDSAPQPSDIRSPKRSAGIDLSQIATRAIEELSNKVSAVVPIALESSPYFIFLDCPCRRYFVPSKKEKGNNDKHG